MEKGSLLYELVSERVKALEAEKEKKEAWKKNIDFPKLFINMNYFTVWTYGQIDPYKQLKGFKAILERSEQASLGKTNPDASNSSWKGISFCILYFLLLGCCYGFRASVEDKLTVLFLYRARRDSRGDVLYGIEDKTESLSFKRQDLVVVLGEVWNDRSMFYVMDTFQISF